MTTPSGAQRRGAADPVSHRGPLAWCRHLARTTTWA